MPLAPSTTALATVKTTSGTTGSLSGEAMEELDLTTLGYPRYSVYQITDPTKRYLARSAVPTFEYDADGGTTWVTLTPAEIQYAGGCIVLSTPLTVDADVQCKSATYYTTSTTLLGGSVARISNGPQLVDTTMLGDGYTRRFPTIKDWSMTLDTFVVSSCASYTTNMTGHTNNDIVFEHAAGGTGGNSYTITLTNSGGTNALSIAVTGTAVDITLASTSGTITSIASDVITAVNNSPACQFIKFTARNATGNDGTGLVEDFTVQSLTGGVDPVNHTAKHGITLIVELYLSSSADSRLEGYAYLESIEDNFDPKDVVKENLNFKGDGPLYYRTS